MSIGNMAKVSASRMRYSSVAVDCIALNYSGKHKRKMAIRGIKLTGKQPAAIELHRRVHSLLPTTFNYQSQLQYQ